MNTLITNKDKPSNCLNCPFSLKSAAGKSGVYCNYLSKYVTKFLGPMNTDCPLFSLSEFKEDNAMVIKVKYLVSVGELKAIEKGDWIDLRSRETVQFAPWNYYEIPLGVAMKLPDGYEAIIAPRSSLFKKYGLLQTNGLGIVTGHCAVLGRVEP